MSTYYLPNSSIPFSQIKTFNHNGVTVDEIEDDVVCLADGQNYLWAELNPELETIKFGEGKATIFAAKRYECVLFSRFGANEPEMIIEAIEEFFDVALISEHDEGFSAILDGKSELNKADKHADRCEMCGTELQEGDDTYCEDCMIIMGAGGSAHYMAEQIRKERRKRKGRKTTVKMVKKELQAVCKRLKALTKKMERVTRAVDKLEKAESGTKDRRRKRRGSVKTGTLTKELLDQQRDWIENYLGVPVCETCRHHGKKP